MAHFAFFLNYTRPCGAVVGLEPTPATLVSRHDAVGLNGIEPLSLRHSGRPLYPESRLAGLEHRLASSN